MNYILPHLNDLPTTNDPALISELQDISRETLRDIAIAIFGAYLLWIFVGAMTWPVELGPKIWISAFAFLPFLGLTFWLLPRHISLARATLQASLLIGIAINLFLFRRPEIGFFLALLPLVSVTIAGWKTGLVMELMVACFVFLPFRAFLEPGSAGLPFVLLIGGAFTGLLGYVTRRTLLIVTERSLSSYAYARENMLEAREHRGKLVKVLKDLDLAYYRLERANSALMSASKAAEEAERMKSELATTISHELRTPLNLVIGFVEVMMTSPESYGSIELPSAYRGDLNAIYRSALHILALVDDVIDMARLDIGHLGMTRSRNQPAAVMSEAIEMVRDYINTKGLALDIQIENNLPAIWMDRLRVRQVLLNLLVNATRFTTHGSITIRACRMDEVLKIEVIDTGKGISAKDLPGVFDEFQTSSLQDSTWHSGSGLGLPISKKIIEAHGGRMGVESVYGEGATFWFTLPISAESSEGASEADFQKTAYSIRPARLADPLVPAVVTTYADTSIQSMIQRELGDYQVYQAADLADAAQMAEQHEALAIITDQPLESVPPHSKRLYIHCRMPSIHQAMQNLGARDLLVKPVTAQLLWETIDRLGIQPESALIVDDDMNITRLFRRILRMRISNDHLYELNQGEEAIERMGKLQPGLVLLDLDMPGTDGFMVLEQKKSDPALKNIPVIVITGHEDELAEHAPGDRRPRNPETLISIMQPAGFRPGEAIQAMDAVIRSLSPQVDWAGSNAQAPRSKLAARRAWLDTPTPPDSAPAPAM